MKIPHLFYAAFLQSYVLAELVPYPFFAVPLQSSFNNQAASKNGSVGDFDERGGTYAASFLPAGQWTYDGITYDLPEEWGAVNDNLLANGQTLFLEEPLVMQEMHLLYAGDKGASHEFSSNFTLKFLNNSTQTVQLHGKNWSNWPLLNKCPIQGPFSFVNHSSQTNHNTTQICQWSTSILSESELLSITLPARTNPRLHIFSFALSPAAPAQNVTGPVLSIRRARFSQRWEMIDGVRAQAVEIALANLLPSSAASPSTSITSDHTISITGPEDVVTLAPGLISRLVPGDQVQVDVFIRGARDNDTVTIQVHDASGTLVGESYCIATALVTEWTTDPVQLALHETPTWWNNAKYGIFIHWGVYSVPAWGPPNKYAEWYDWDLHQVGSPTWSHHNNTFGPDVHYDDFATNFTASEFNASAWIDLFLGAGAKYFVIVTKHHDGWTLFDAGNTTDRSLVKMGPKRDFVQELMSAAKEQAPELHRGTYYSLPEWFHPDYAAYGFREWPGGLSYDPFDLSSTEPYTGYVNISDYLQDLQLPQMLDIALKYDTDVMWCDIGGPNETPRFASQFFNHAMKQGREVAINNRCGSTLVNDFDTPEYATFGNTVTHSWESSEGMDPFSYGFNSATNTSGYKTADSIVQTLVDIVSKNGNYLLDIGPMESGAVVETEINNLLRAGAWLKYSGSCIYETKFWFPGPQDTGEVNTRFTTKPNSFCFIAMDQPSGGQLTVNKRVPILDGDEVFLLSPDAEVASQPLPWSADDGGRLVVNVSDHAIGTVKFAWAFEIRYRIST
jgi:alpha-L-fucosidase